MNNVKHSEIDLFIKLIKSSIECSRKRKLSEQKTIDVPININKRITKKKFLTQGDDILKDTYATTVVSRKSFYEAYMLQIERKSQSKGNKNQIKMNRPISVTQYSKNIKIQPFQFSKKCHITKHKHKYFRLKKSQQRSPHSNLKYYENNKQIDNIFVFKQQKDCIFGTKKQLKNKFQTQQSSKQIQLISNSNKQMTKLSIKQSIKQNIKSLKWKSTISQTPNPNNQLHGYFEKNFNEINPWVVNND